MPAWEGKTRGNRFGYRFFIFILKYFGIRFTYLFLHFVVTYFFLFTGKERNAICWYYRKILKKGKMASVAGVYRNFYTLGQILIDKVALLSGFHTRFTFDFDGENYLHQMIKKGSGGMLIGAHMGNWEVAGQLLDRVTTRVNIVMLDAEHERIKSLLEEVIKRHEVKIIPIKDDLSHLIAIRNALQNNELVSIHGDRFMEGSKTVETVVAGEKATLPLGPFLLATKYRKPITFVMAAREKGFHYHFTATPPKVYAAPADRKKENTALSQIINDYSLWLEEKIMRYPHQWFNYFPFWDAQW